jgi:hypothetical protein
MDLGQEMFTDEEVKMIDEAHAFLSAVADRLSEKEQTDG